MGVGTGDGQKQAPAARRPRDFMLFCLSFLVCEDENKEVSAFPEGRSLQAGSTGSLRTQRRATPALSLPVVTQLPGACLVFPAQGCCKCRAWLTQAAAPTRRLHAVFSPEFSFHRDLPAAQPSLLKLSKRPE